MLKGASNSLFDEYRACNFQSTTFDWIQTANFIDVDPEHFIYEGNLEECFEMNISEYRHYILTKDILISKRICKAIDDPVDNLKGKSYNTYVMKLMNPRLKKIKADDKYGFKLISGPITKKFWCESRQEMQFWCDSLREVCILENIESKYSFGDILGAGSSACVKLGQHKESTQQFAVKCIPKVKLHEKPCTLVCKFFKT